MKQNSMPIVTGGTCGVVSDDFMLGFIWTWSSLPRSHCAQWGSAPSKDVLISVVAVHG
jgi:hypothetical protein